MNRKVKLGLIVWEFMAPDLENHSALGGYGMIARHYIAKHIPNERIEVEAILGTVQSATVRTIEFENGIKAHLLPGGASRAPFWLLRKFANRTIDRRARKFLDRFDIFMIIEASNSGVLKYITHKPLILNIQDPRPQGEWDQIDTVPNADTGSPRPSPYLDRLFNQFLERGKLVAFAQGEYLVPLARELYKLPAEFQPEVIKNPIEVPTLTDSDFAAKENAVVWLGRLDCVKRPWLALEVAKLMPDIKFYFLGKVQQEVVNLITYPYRKLENVTYLGHVEDVRKSEILKKSKVLINTSIHEATPVSFLEALAYGNLLVSCQNPDGLTSKFGHYTGRILGDGREQAERFVEGINSILADESGRVRKARSAIEYVRREHDLGRWCSRIRRLIIENVR